MKKVENKQTELQLDESTKAKYSDLLFLVVNRPINPNEPITLSDMATDIKIMNAIKDATDEIVFEDSDFEKVKNLVKESKWTARHADIVEFGAYIDSI